MNRTAGRALLLVSLMLGLMIGQVIMNDRAEPELVLDPLYPAAPSPPPPPESQGFTYEVVNVAPGIRCVVFTHLWNGHVRHDAAIGVDCWEDR